MVVLLDGGRVWELLGAEVGGGDTEDDEAFVGIGLLQVIERCDLVIVDGFAGQVDDEQDFPFVGGERNYFAVERDERIVIDGLVLVRFGCAGEVRADKQDDQQTQHKP